MDHTPPKSFYCHDLIANCLTLKRKELEKPAKQKKTHPISLISFLGQTLSATDENEEEVDVAFELFISKGFVSFVGMTEQVPLTVL